jgi:pimeloyl-ACP methyl ester carboxylesterase
LSAALEFTEAPPEFLARADGSQIACRFQAGGDQDDIGPVLVFLPGYMSDMQGGKAQALSAWASEHGRAMLRLDYSGCGESGGEFADGSFTKWRDEVLAAIDHYGCDKVILIGSSMGGWLMLLVGIALGDRLSGMIGIAAAPDFTEWGLTEAQKTELAKNGVVFEDNPYGPEPTPTYLKLWEDGQRHRLLGQEIPLGCPVRLLHGQQDKDVPWQISMQLAENLRSDDVQIRLIKDGDHRLSRPQDIALLVETAAGLVL